MRSNDDDVDKRHRAGVLSHPIVNRYFELKYYGKLSGPISITFQIKKFDDFEVS